MNKKNKQLTYLNFFKKNIYKSLLFVFFILLILISVFIAPFLIKNKNLTNISKTQNWKKYYSELGFSLEIPEGYFFKDDGPLFIYSWDPDSNKYDKYGEIAIDEVKIEISTGIYDMNIDDFVKYNFLKDSELNNKNKDFEVSKHKAKMVMTPMYAGPAHDFVENMPVHYLIELTDSSLLSVYVNINDNSNQTIKDKYLNDISKMVDSIEFN